MQPRNWSVTIVTTQNISGDQQISKSLHLSGQVTENGTGGSEVDTLRRRSLQLKSRNLSRLQHLLQLACLLSLRSSATLRGFMNVWQLQWTPGSGLLPETGAVPTAHLVLLFGSRAALLNAESLAAIRRRFPTASFLGCSTAGEVLGTQIYDETVSVTAIHFDDTRISTASVPIASPEESYDVGAALARSFDPKDLVHLFVLSDGLHVNGSELVRGLSEHLPSDATLSGGLAGDGEAFGETVVVADQGVSSQTVAAVGFYGDRLQVGCASLGGWDSFGPERLVTKSAGN